jgi:uncharacterized protein involved in tolerance to divalent cations
MKMVYKFTGLGLVNIVDGCRKMLDEMKRFYCWRESVTINAPTKFVVKILTNVNHRQHYDKSLASIQRVEQMGAGKINLFNLI